MEKLIDVVYPIGTGSRWDNNELRFSLRAIEKYGRNVGKIVIVGVLPDFLDNQVIHIPVKDFFSPSVNADGNIIKKVLAACTDMRISEDFLFINDDHILLKEIKLNEVPNFHKGNMNEYQENYWKLNYWRSRLKKTRDTLNKMGLTAYHFDCHTPIICNKKKFIEAMEKFNYSEGVGLTMKSLYGNLYYKDNCKLLSYEKKTIFVKFDELQIDARLKHAQFLSFNDTGLNESLKIWLFKKFPEESKWEKTAIKERDMEIVKWLNGNKDYKAE